MSQCAPSFASLWLAPRLAQYRRVAPEADIRVDSSEDLLALDSTGFDLAIRLAPIESAESSWKLLAREHLMLVAAPAVARQIREPGDLTRWPLLVFRHRTARWPGMSWNDWYERFGLPHSPHQPAYQFSQYEHLMKAAASGLGIAIGRTPLILPALCSGELEVVLPDVVADGLGYFLIFSKHSRERPAAKGFAAWIEHELSREALG